MTRTGAAEEEKEKAQETAKPDAAADNSDRVRLKLKSVSCCGNGEHY
jgi:hypothetical protein